MYAFEGNPSCVANGAAYGGLPTSADCAHIVNSIDPPRVGQFCRIVSTAWCLVFRLFFLLITGSAIGRAALDLD